MKKAELIYFCSFRAWDSETNGYRNFKGICGINTDNIYDLNEEDIIWIISAQTGKNFKLNEVNDFSINFIPYCKVASI